MPVELAKSEWIGVLKLSKQWDMPLVRDLSSPYPAHTLPDPRFSM